MARGQQIGQAVEGRLRLALKAGGFGTWVWDRASGVTIWDEDLEAIFGLPPGGFDGTYDAWLSMLHPDDRDSVLRHIDEAMERRGTYEIRHRIVWPDGSVHWIDGLGQITIDEAGEPTGSIGCTRDVTAQVLIEEQLAASVDDARQAADEAELLQAVTAELAGAITLDEIADTLAERVEGLLGATAAAVAILSRSGTSLRMVSSFGFPGGRSSEYSNLPLTMSSPMTDSVRTGRPVVVTAAELPAAYPHLAAVNEGTGHTLYLARSLQVPGRMLGVLCLAFSERTSIDLHEMSLVDAVAGQCSLAFDRARLVERLNEVATTMQDGLFPQDLRDLPSYELAAVYAPGGDEMEHLGGDWYDVVDIGRGDAALIVGDVMGRGVSAASTMVRLRTAARAYAWEDPTPEVVLRRLDGFVLREAAEDFITMIYVRLDSRTGGLRLMNAGHLPAVLISPQAPPQLLWGQANLPLGLGQGTRRSETATLEPGDTLLLFTDGLIERRDRDIEDCLAELCAAAGSGPGDLALGEYLRDLVAKVAPHGGQDDDVTALIIRRISPCASLQAEPSPGKVSV